MDWISLKTNIMQMLDKYKYVALVVVIGLVLMAMPSRTEPTESQDQAIPQTDSQVSLEEKMEELLSQIQGAGEVRVLLTLATGEEILYQTDEDIESDDNGYTEVIDTVIVSNQDRDQEGLVRQINPPQYLGAVVVCQGADSTTVRLAIVDAVSKATGLGSDKISVLKMK